MKTLINVALMLAGLASQTAFGATPHLHSTNAIVFDATNQKVLLEKDAQTPVPFASVTKLLTAMVALDAKPDLSEKLSVAPSDVDTVKHSSSRVRVGTELSRKDMLHLALMSSENRAASALSRHYPGGQGAFVDAMNRKARRIGMTHTRVEDPTGLSPENRGSAEDLMRMVLAAERYDSITEFSTSSGHAVPIGNRILNYKNTNPLVGKSNWDIELSKTGYTREAGRCIVMKMAAAGKELVVVLLGSHSSSARLADIQTIKRWITGEPVERARNVVRKYARSTTRSHASLKAAKKRGKAKAAGPRAKAKKSTGVRKSSVAKKRTKTTSKAKVARKKSPRKSARGN